MGRDDGRPRHGGRRVLGVAQTGAGRDDQGGGMVGPRRRATGADAGPGATAIEEAARETPIAARQPRGPQGRGGRPFAQRRRDGGF